MKSLILLIFLFTLNLYSQDNGTGKIQPTDPDNDYGFRDEELDKEFYINYLSLPGAKYQKEKVEGEKKLNEKLLKIFKAEVEKRDLEVSKETLKEISSRTVRIKRVFPDSDWMVRLKKEFSRADVTISFTDYMYILKYRKYYTLITFEYDPVKHHVSPNQVELVFNKE